MNGSATVQFERENVAEIRLQEGESLENALRRFKRKVQTEDIIKEVKRHSYYLKPGERRRVKQALARKRARKKNRKEGSFAKDVRRD
jgi:small subunit ribosomal protein S21